MNEHFLRSLTIDYIEIRGCEMVEKNALSAGHGEHVAGVGESNAEWALGVDAAEKARLNLMVFVENRCQTKQSNAIDGIVLASEGHANAFGIDMERRKALLRSVLNPFGLDQSHCCATKLVAVAEKRETDRQTMLDRSLFDMAQAKRETMRGWGSVEGASKHDDEIGRISSSLSLVLHLCGE